MSDILKTETEAIVYLAENLTNLSSKIDDLFLPVAQLLEEIRVSSRRRARISLFLYTKASRIKKTVLFVVYSSKPCKITFYAVFPFVTFSP